MTRARMPGIEELREDEMSRLLGQLFARRLIGAPLGLVLVGIFVWNDRALWRQVTLLGWFSALATVSLYTVWHLRRGRLLSTILPLNVVMMTATLIAAITASGGVDSPILPQLLTLAILVPLITPWQLALPCLLAQAVALFILTVVQGLGAAQDFMPALFGGGPHAGSAALVWMRGSLATLALIISYLVGQRIRSAFETVALRAVRGRDEALADHAEQMRSLTTMAGEIAHELKNPLASIKGLAGLVARGLSGAQAEQMAVLRREVERMQGILDEFLNFSRPLVPLAVEEVAIGALCADVLQLVGTVAAEREVALELDGPEGLRLRCDRRKVKQILVNLTQNALDASPRGGVVRLVIDRTTLGAGEAVRVRVIDRGPGLDPHLKGRVFEPGVTTKPGGSGLGLTISRLLARQHEGELALHSSSAGCIAELILPVAPAEDAP